MFHKVTIVGHLGQDPETRFLQSGSSVCSFSVATNREYTLSSGERVKETVWWRVSAWGKLGEICQQYLNKGRMVLIEGSIQADRNTGSPRIWTDQNGQPRASFELMANTMKMLGGRNDSGGYNNAYNQEYSQGPARSAPAQQRSAPPQQRPAPAQRAAPPAQRAAPPAQQQYGQGAQRQAPPQRAGQPPRRDRRSTVSAPQTNDFNDDDFGPDEIPF